MNARLIKSYLKYSYKGIIIWLAIIMLYNYFEKGESLVGNLLFFFIGFSREFYHYGDKLEKLKKLKARGLTEQDLINIEFVKKWEETRKEGLWKYCIRDGGIIAGSGFALVLSLLFAIVFPHRFMAILAEPGDMFSFIGYSFLAGILFGLLLFRLLWMYKEHSFNRLTDPLNTIFSSKNSLFNKQA